MTLLHMQECKWPSCSTSPSAEPSNAQQLCACQRSKNNKPHQQPTNVSTHQAGLALLQHTATHGLPLGLTSNSMQEQLAQVLVRIIDG
jgi:hypothetical protein